MACTNPLPPPVAASRTRHHQLVTFSGLARLPQFNCYFFTAYYHYVKEHRPPGSHRPARKPSSREPDPGASPPDHSGRCIMVLSIASTTIHPHQPAQHFLPPAPWSYGDSPTAVGTGFSPPGSVELRGLEPRTPCLQSRCSSQLSYSPVISGSDYSGSVG
jgi:hypothetical protein